MLLSRLHTLLGDHCTISLKPVIDLPSGHTPVDGYEIPASLRADNSAIPPTSSPTPQQ